MQLRVVLAKIGIGVSLLASLAISGQALASDSTCQQLMYDHGLATAAQFRCGYEHYNENIINKARSCMASAKESGSDEWLMEALKSGLKDFNEAYDEAHGTHKLCSDFARDYPSFVYP